LCIARHCPRKRVAQVHRQRLTLWQPCDRCERTLSKERLLVDQRIVRVLYVAPFRLQRAQQTVDRYDHAGRVGTNKELKIHTLNVRRAAEGVETQSFECVGEVEKVGISSGWPWAALQKLKAMHSLLRSETEEIQSETNWASERRKRPSSKVRQWRMELSRKNAVSGMRLCCEGGVRRPNPKSQ